MEDYYRILGVSRNATKDEIKDNFRKLALVYHPDKNKNSESNEKFREINEAYDTLIDDKKRKDYDYNLGYAPPSSKNEEPRQPQGKKGASSDELEIRTLYNIMKVFHRIIVDYRADRRLTSEDVELLNECRKELLHNETVDRMSTVITADNFVKYLTPLFKLYDEVDRDHKPMVKQVVRELSNYIEEKWHKKSLSHFLDKIEKDRDDWQIAEKKRLEKERHEKEKYARTWGRVITLFKAFIVLWLILIISIFIYSAYKTNNTNPRLQLIPGQDTSFRQINNTQTPRDGIQIPDLFPDLEGEGFTNTATLPNGSVMIMKYGDNISGTALYNSPSTMSGFVIGIQKYENDSDAEQQLLSTTSALQQLEAGQQDLSKINPGFQQPGDLESFHPLNYPENMLGSEALITFYTLQNGNKTQGEVVIDTVNSGYGFNVQYMKHFNETPDYSEMQDMAINVSNMLISNLK